MSRRVVRSCAVASFVLVLGLASEARAQISIGGSFIYNRPGFQPAQPYQPYQPTIQPAQPYQPYQPTIQPAQPYQPYPPTQPTIQPYPPTQPGIGGPSYPYPPNPYNPNGVANMSSSSAMYWDPARGWVTNTQNTQTLNSFYSPARNTIMPGTSVQTYTYWNGTQYVQGTRWLGVDGQWHGDQSNTVVAPDGSTTTNTVYRSVNPNARGAAPATAPAPATTPAPGFGTAPIFRRP